MLRPQLSDNEPADPEEQGIPGSEDANIVLIGVRSDAFKNGRQPVFDDDAFALELRKEIQLTLAARENLGPCHGVHCTAG